jgi:carbonic anhydrase
VAATVASRESEAAPLGGGRAAPIALLTASPAQSVAPPTGTVAPGEALAQLMAGNNKFQSADLPQVDAIEERRQMLLDGQAPHAVVLACSDSRVSPDLIFAQGLGDLFVVRVAGNFPDDLVLGSIEFAITELGSRLVMVLGHEKCGAVQAVYGALATSSSLPGHLATFERLLSPGLRASVQAGATQDEAVRANVRAAVAELRSSSPVLDSAVASGRVQVVGAEYRLASGAVTLVD